MKDKKKQQCATVIPKDWPKFTTPDVGNMGLKEAKTAWYAYLRQTRDLAPTPKIARKG